MKAWTILRTGSPESSIDGLGSPCPEGCSNKEFNCRTFGERCESVGDSDRKVGEEDVEAFDKAFGVIDLVLGPPGSGGNLSSTADTGRRPADVFIAIAAVATGDPRTVSSEDASCVGWVMKATCGQRQIVLEGLAWTDSLNALERRSSQKGG